VNEPDITLKAASPLPATATLPPELLPAARVTFVHRIARRRGVRQFVKFAIVGGSGLVVNIVVFTILQHFTPLAVVHARYNFNYSVGFLSGGVSNYFLNRLWTFRSSAHALKQGAQFIGVSLLALAVGLIVSHFLVPIPFFGPGHKTWFVATLSAIGVNFFINKYWTFRES
jgi:dolichol-phosphate mannosyltransferase